MTGYLKSIFEIFLGLTVKYMASSSHYLVRTMTEVLCSYSTVILQTTSTTARHLSECSLSWTLSLINIRVMFLLTQLLLLSVGRSIWTGDWSCNAAAWLLLWQKAYLQSSSIMLLRQATMYYTARCKILHVSEQVSMYCCVYKVYCKDGVSIRLMSVCRCSYLALSFVAL